MDKNQEFPLPREDFDEIDYFDYDIEDEQLIPWNEFI